MLNFHKYSRDIANLNCTLEIIERKIIIVQCEKMSNRSIKQSELPPPSNSSPSTLLLPNVSFYLTISLLIYLNLCKSPLNNIVAIKKFF
ncbi:uncharacterised protein [Saccharolobus solfataricus]|uniref:Uncharacterized protein n=1 Tax=Saccharolobus solfataricus TaxID=2287 RepID=A0A157T0L6_SACSO|nr:uncharacterised protein [Saccharolobus solfataricus]